MAKKAAAQDTEEVISPEKLLGSFLTDNKEDHFNFEPDYGEGYCVSSGSLLLDVAMGGGLKPSILRNVGLTEGGKTSNSLAFLHNFLKIKEKRRGLYIKAEGRLSKEMQERSGINFVTEAAEWKDGTCFVFKSNIYETIINLINQFINNNEEGYRYFIIIDSMDSLLSKVDKDKKPEDANKVAATASLSTDFLRRMSLPLSSRGHICILISQVRSAVQINPYAKGDPKVTNASGGNALLHYPDWIFEFQPRYQDDFIWAGEKGKSERLGHFCKLIFRKSTNEGTGKEVRYPIKYKRTGGNSVWVEYEIYDYLEMFDWFSYNQKGGWITPQKELVDKLKEGGFTIFEKIQGKPNFIKFLEENPKITNYLIAHFKSILSKTQIG